MPQYRRPRQLGGTWFFTVALQRRGSRLLVEHSDELVAIVDRVRQERPFEIDALVLLPDHLHAIWTLGEDDGDFSGRWASIKAQFSRLFPIGETRSPSRRRRGERGVWQRRFWEHLIRDADDYERHIDYCYFNPVRHGLVSRVRDWPHSTFHRDVEKCLFPADWGGAIGEIRGEFGEIQ